MSSPEERIKAAIQKIAQKPRSVLFEEIDWVMTHLETDLEYRVRKTGKNKHYTFTVGDLEAFQVCDHHRGQAQVKTCYVRAFLARMMDLGLYED